jgi:F0F1-type ATP synthase assembly protein I
VWKCANPEAFLSENTKSQTCLVDNLNIFIYNIVWLFLSHRNLELNEVKTMNQLVKMIYLILQIGLTMLVTVFICIGLGYLLERLFGVNLMVLFIVLGVLAGMRSTYVLIRKFVSSNNPDDEYIRLLRQKPDDTADDEDEDL